jgi:AcrR family transcriptional regulator
LAQEFSFVKTTTRILQMATVEASRRSSPSVVEPPSSRATTSSADTKSVASKEAVLDAAQRLSTQFGYGGFSMRDLAQHAGLAKATLYHHFQDKREIFLQVLQRDLNVVSSCIATAAATPGDLRTRLGAVAAAFFALAAERGLPLLSTLRQAAGTDREFCDLLRQYHEISQRPIVQMLQEAIDNGTIRQIDPDSAAMSFFGILQVFTSRHLLMQDMELDQKAVDFVVDMTLHGLACQPDSDAT